MLKIRKKIRNNVTSEKWNKIKEFMLDYKNYKKLTSYGHVQRMVQKKAPKNV